MKAVALVVACVLILAFGSWKSSEAPLTVTCGSVSGGNTATAKGVEYARKFGSWVHDVATNPEQYRDPQAIKRTVDGVFNQVIWYWLRTAFQSARGEKIDPEILKLEADQAKAAQDANDQCTPCPTGQAQAPEGDTPSPLTTTSVSSRAEGSSAQEVARAAASRYFPADQVNVATAVAGAESSYRPNALLNYRGMRMLGLWQINDHAHPDLVRGRDWKDPNVNAWMAFQVWKAAGKSWRPWSTYNSGSYKSHLSAAEPTDPQSPAAPQSPNDATPTPGCANGTGGPNATIATWNPYGGNSAANVRKGIATLAKTSSAIGLQEMGGDWHRIIMGALPAGWEMVGGNTSQPIVFDGGKFSAVSSSADLVLARHLDGFDYGARYIVGVQLRDKSTGQTFHMLNTHLWPHATNGVTGNFVKNGRLVDNYRDHMDELVTKVDTARATGDAVIVTGDFNSAFDPWGLMAKHGMRSNWSVLGVEGTVSKTRAIDYVWTSGAAPAAQRVVGSFGSDHKAVEVTYIGSAPNRLEASTSTASVRTVTDPTSKLTYQIPIPAGPRGVAINFALDQLGERYVFGAHGPDRWDCSGLVSGAWAKAGVKFTPQTSVMLRTVPKAQGKAQPGDLPTTHAHTQMYLGRVNGQSLVVEAPNPRARVRIVRQWMTPVAVLDPTKMGNPA